MTFSKHFPIIKIGDSMKKGFTLTELLGVIVILGLIALIAVPAINSALNSSKQKAFDEQVKTIENTARTYMADNPLKLPSMSGGKCFLSVETLKDEGLLEDEDLENPKYKKNSTEGTESKDYFNGGIIITYDTSKSKYTYEYVTTNTGATDC